MTKQSIIFKNLRQVRKFMGLNISEFSKLCGINEGSYQRKEVGYQLSKKICTRHYFSNEDKQNIADVVIEWLFQEDEQCKEMFKSNKEIVYKQRKDTKNKSKDKYSRAEVENIIKELLDNKEILNGKKEVK